MAHGPRCPAINATAMILLLAVIAILFLAGIALADLSWNSVLSTARNDLVFEGRNRAYGAYPLRRDHPRVLLFATLSTAAAIGAAIALARSFASDPPVTAKPPVVVEVDLDRIYSPPRQKITKPAEKRIEPPVKERRPGDLTAPLDSIVAAPDTTTSMAAGPDTTSMKGEAGPKTPDPGDGGANTVGPEPPRWGAEVMPEFPGGQEALRKWFARNIVFEVEWLDGKRSAQVFIEFVIDAEGRVASATVLKGVNGRLDSAVLRAVRSMPAWRPGRQGGHPVSVRFAQPVNFKVLP